MADCPFCKTEIHPEATVCPACQATQGYAYGDEIHGKLTAIIVFIVSAAMLLGSAAWVLFLREVYDASKLSYIIVAILVVLGLPLFLSLGWQLLRGPAWIRSSTPR